FDQGLDNDLGVPADDFILKPWRHSELLDWLERRLGLDWLAAAPTSEPVAPAAPPAEPLPAAPVLQALLEAADLGYYRGILNTLAQIEQQQPDCQAFVARMRELARQFQFETMVQQLGPLLQQPDPAPGTETHCHEPRQA
ncbi:MAG: hypothetical protein RIS90_487, partial [Pseudomonadota bacterium]